MEYVPAGTSLTIYLPFQFGIAYNVSVVLDIVTRGEAPKGNTCPSILAVTLLLNTMISGFKRKVPFQKKIDLARLKSSHISNSLFVTDETFSRCTLMSKYGLGPNTASG